MSSVRAAKRVLVTGANRGIGREVVRQLADLGYSVHLGARDLAKGEAAAREIRGDVKAIQLDVADKASIESAAKTLIAGFGGVDILVNNAGIHYDSYQRATDSNWRIIRKAFEVNLFGAWRLAQALVPAMRERRWGRIVNVSSESGSLDSMDGSTPAYSTSKAALNALTRCLAGELANDGILVNAVCPGWTATDMGGGGRPVPSGARSVIWAVTLEDDGPNGGFFRDGVPLPW
jgi:NAD(P)-dependent dehydrogenase (short-subunit alcohol dehydrogenase family)